MNWLTYLLTIAAGAANPVQSGANAELKKSLNDPVWAALVIYGSGFCAMLLAQAFARRAWPEIERLTGTHWWAWLGGLISIGSTMAGLAFAQKLGAGVFTGLSVTASLAASIALDHFGLIGFKTHPISVLRIVGSGMMVGGLWLIAKF